MMAVRAGSRFLFLPLDGDASMPDVAEQQNAPAPGVATQTLAAEISRILSTESSDTPRLVRVETPVATLRPVDWLRAQAGMTHYYWADRNDEFTMAGVGEADVLVGSPAAPREDLFEYMRSRLPADKHSLRYYGGFRFQDPRETDPKWQNFKGYRFVAPRFEVLRRGSKTVLACNAVLAKPKTNDHTREAIMADLGRLQFPDSAPGSDVPPFVNRLDDPDKGDWGGLVQDALEAIRRGRFDKVVLARETTLHTEGELNAVSVLTRLLAHSSNAFEFCFHPAEGRAFIGATPERLFKRVNVYVLSEAVAGTRPRGKTDDEDEELAEALRGSEKDRREHAIVVDTVREQLASVCHTVEVTEKPKLLRLRNCQHLWSPMEGILKDETGDAALLRLLHPTPAVGGSPRAAALEWLRENEPFDRGIYAAPVGWVGYDAAEFTVGIRGALVRPNELTIYAGAGIVSGSDADQEWAEVENKMANFLSVMR